MPAEGGDPVALVTVPEGGNSIQMSSSWPPAAAPVCGRSAALTDPARWLAMRVIFRMPRSARGGRLPDLAERVAVDRAAVDVEGGGARTSRGRRRAASRGQSPRVGRRSGPHAPRTAGPAASRGATDRPSTTRPRRTSPGASAGPRAARAAGDGRPAPPPRRRADVAGCSSCSRPSAGDWRCSPRTGDTGTTRRAPRRGRSCGPRRVRRGSSTASRGLPSDAARRRPRDAPLPALDVDGGEIYRHALSEIGQPPPAG